MSFLRLSSLAVLGSLVTVACNGGLIHEVGDINSAGGASGSTSTPPVAGATTSLGGDGGGAVLLAAGHTGFPLQGGSSSTGGNSAGGYTGFPTPGGAGGNSAAGHTGFPIPILQGGATATGGMSATGGMGPVAPEENVTAFATWTTFMGPPSFRMAWHNGTNHSIFIRCEGNWARLEGGNWVAKNGACLSGGSDLLREILPGATFYSQSLYFLDYIGSGTYHMEGRYWVGCLGSDCAASRQIASSPVQVVVRAGPNGSAGAAGSAGILDGSAGAAGASGSSAEPDGLHANCSSDEPCPANQTALGIFYSNHATCSCEIPCD